MISAWNERCCLPSAGKHTIAEVVPRILLSAIMSIHYSQAVFAEELRGEEVAGRISFIVSQGESCLAGASEGCDRWHHSAMPNLKRWCEVLELVDSTLVALLSKFEAELLVPVYATRVNSGVIGR